MALLKAEDQKQIRQHFEAMTNDVKVIVFTSDDGCDYCDDTKQIIEEVVALSPKIGVEYHDVAMDSGVAALYGVDRAPAIVVAQIDRKSGEVKDFGVRFFGIPSGYEFSTLLEGINLVSTEGASLAKATDEWLKSVDTPIRLQVFVTPTCPYCPQMVNLAHRLAVASDKVRAEGVEATEFPELANRYGVYGVPRTVISAGGNDVHIEGAVPESKLLSEIKRALAGAAV